MQLLDRADQLMDGGADAGQLDDIGVRQEGEATEIRVRILPEFGFLIMQWHATDSVA
ncbi:hypothetical protein P0D69_09650 [Paraburkholderia sediminicola]|uniref:hypothetical protein n=1 Tax=Paraburkholderia sediminicola TaxID=458836 RepID=UPI0038BCBC2E